MGALTAMANLAFFALAVSGGLEDTLSDAGYSLEGTTGMVVGFTAIGAILGILGIVSGIGVLRLRSVWRVTGIAVAALGALSMLVNLVGLGNLLSLIFVLVYVHIIVGLARSGDVFAQPAS